MNYINFLLIIHHVSCINISVAETAATSITHQLRVKQPGTSGNQPAKGKYTYG